MIIIKKVSTNDIIPIRHAVLRTNKPIESCCFDSDDQPSTVHFGLFVDKKIVGCATIVTNFNTIFDAQMQFQLRGMAVLSKYQNCGLGRLLLLECEKFATQNKGEIIWFNARQNAIKFYEAIGYQCTGTFFEINLVGSHIIMYKKIKK